MIYFFDDFDDNNLDPTKWGSWPYPGLAEQNGHLEQPDANVDPGIAYAVSGGAMFSADLIGREVAWEMSLYDATLGQALFMLLSGGLAKACSLWVGYNSWGWGFEDAGSSSFDAPLAAPVADQVYKCKIKFISRTQVEWYVDDVLVKTSDPGIPLTIEPAAFIFSSNRKGKFNDFIFQDSPGKTLDLPTAILI